MRSRLNKVKRKKCILGITIDNDLKFEDHINNICGKAGVKISALSRRAPCMDLPKRKQKTNTFFQISVLLQPFNMDDA